MSDNQYFKFSNAVLIAPLVSVLTIWTVFWLELRTRTNFNDLGIYPKTISGLKGIVLSPFIHGSLEHLYNNTLPLMVLMAALFYFYRAQAIKVVLIGIVLSGCITWAIGRPSYHIGASGLIYVLASFIFFKGVFSKYYRLVALSLMVVFVYGSLLWYIFPVKEGISREGHLGGFLSGLVLAVLLKTHLPVLKKYEWEQDDYNETEDEFLKHFDEDGNFVASTPEDAATDGNRVKITYHFKESKPKREDAD